MVALITVRPPVGTPACDTCKHLAPLEAELAAAGVPVGPGRPCPHDPEWGTWFEVDAIVDVASLSSRLALDPCVTYEEYETAVCNNGPDDATFYCDCCGQAIVSLHPRLAPLGTPRVG